VAHQKSKVFVCLINIQLHLRISRKVTHLGKFKCDSYCTGELKPRRMEATGGSAMFSNTKVCQQTFVVQSGSKYNDQEDTDDKANGARSPGLELQTKFN
jgi:hypothetical protein